MKKERIDYFDNLKALLIFLVVFGHLLILYRFTNVYASGIINFIYFFHMPLFIFITGYFSKHDNKNIVTAYLIPYLVFNYLYGYFFPNSYGFSIVLPNFVYWFLMSLICWKLIIKYLDKIKGIFIISIIIAIFAGCFEDISAAFSFSRTLKFLPFFVLGYKFKKEWFLKLKSVPKLLVLFIGLITLIAFFFVNKYEIVTYNLLIKSQPFHTSGFTNSEGVIITTLVILPLTFLMMFLVIYIVPNKRNLFTYIGRNTMVIFLLHSFVYGIYFSVFAKYNFFNNFTEIVLAFLFSILTCLILGSNFISKIYNIFQNKIDRFLIKSD